VTGAARPRPAGLLTESARVEAFSDGVLAIAITLLVLDLDPPSGPDGFVADLLHQGPTYLAYLAAFITIGTIWINHHVTFTRVSHVDPPLLWINLALLATSSVLPFPTAVLARALEEGTPADQTGAVVLYALVSVLQALCWLLLYRHLRRRPDLLSDPADRALFTGEQVRSIIGAACYLAVAGLALILPVAAAVAVLVLPAFYGLTSHGLTIRASLGQGTDT
jgi:uncharacterized membrane protein